MSPTSGGDPADRLSSALRAQASGTSPTARPDATGPEQGVRATSGAGPTVHGAARLPVLRVLLFALVLGLLAGVLVGVLTLL